MIRLFAALSPPPEIVDGLVCRQKGLPGARWSSPDNLHITLRFFGDVSETVAADLDDGLAAFALPPFDVTLAGAGAFGDGERMRAVWAGVDGGEPLRRLAARCGTTARRCGLKPDDRAYRPHVTLAYLKHSPEARVAAWVQDHNLLNSPTWIVRSFGLYSSWRGDEGARYDLERTYPLG